MKMKQITENYWTQVAINRTVGQTVDNYKVLSTVFFPIIKIGGQKVDEIVLRIAKFWATADTGRFVVNGERYRLKSSGRGWQIVAV